MDEETITKLRDSVLSIFCSLNMIEGGKLSPADITLEAADICEMAESIPPIVNADKSIDWEAGL